MKGLSLLSLACCMHSDSNHLWLLPVHAPQVGQVDRTPWGGFGSVLPSPSLPSPLWFCAFPKMLFHVCALSGPEHLLDLPSFPTSRFSSVVTGRGTESCEPQLKTSSLLLADPPSPYPPRLTPRTVGGHTEAAPALDRRVPIRGQARGRDMSQSSWLARGQDCR